MAIARNIRRRCCAGACLRQAVEQCRNGAGFEHGADAGGQQRGHGQDGHVRQALLFGHRNGVGEDDFACAAVLQAFHGRAGQQAVGGDERHGLRAGVVQRAHGLEDGAGGVDHVVDDHAVASLHVTDDAVCLGMVRARGVAGLVDEGERQSAELGGPTVRKP